MVMSISSEVKCSNGFSNSHQILSTCQGYLGSVTPAVWAISTGEGCAADSSAAAHLTRGAVVQRLRAPMAKREKDLPFMRGLILISAFRDIHRKAAAGSFLVFGAHVRAGLTHGG